MHFVNSSASVEMSVNVTSVADEEKKNTYSLYEQMLKIEQFAYGQHQEAARIWETKAHEDCFNYNTARQSTIDNLVSNHSKTHFPIIHLKDAGAVGQAVGVCIGTYADRLGMPKNEVYKVMMVNCSYVGTDANAFAKDMAKIVGDLIASSPAFSCAVVIFSNAWGLVQAETSAPRIQLWFCT